MPATQKKDPMEVAPSRSSSRRAHDKDISGSPIFMAITHLALFLATTYLGTTSLCANIARQAQQLVLGRVLKENSHVLSMMAAGNITLPIFVFGSRIYAAVYNLVVKGLPRNRFIDRITLFIKPREERPGDKLVAFIALIYPMLSLAAIYLGNTSICIAMGRQLEMLLLGSVPKREGAPFYLITSYIVMCFFTACAVGVSCSINRDALPRLSNTLNRASKENNNTPDEEYYSEKEDNNCSNEDGFDAKHSKLE